MVRLLKVHDCGYRVLYDNKRQEVEESREIVVKQQAPVSAETSEKTGVSQQMIEEKGVSLKDAIIQVSAKYYNLGQFLQLHKTLMEKLLFNHKEFQIVTFGDWEVYYQLQIETQKKAILLNPNVTNKHLNFFALSGTIIGKLDELKHLQQASDLALLLAIDEND